jgi:U6 snRNA-associated Sm-like protein LSm7
VEAAVAAASSNPAPAAEKGKDKPTQKKGLIFQDLNKFMNESVRVKFAGGREVTGVLKGYDQLVNIVLDETVEYLRDPCDPYRITDKTRQLGLTVARGTSVMLICPTDGAEEISNPFNSEAEQPLPEN